MAEALLKERIRRDPSLQEIELVVHSAGLDAIEGEPAAEGAVRVLKERAVSLEDHTAKRFGEEHLGYDLILTMTEAHKTRILLTFPEVAAKLYTLKEYAELAGSPDVADPFMRGEEAYRAVLEEIDQAVEALVERLKRELAGADQAKRGESES